MAPITNLALRRNPYNVVISRRIKPSSSRGSISALFPEHAKAQFVPEHAIKSSAFVSFCCTWASILNLGRACILNLRAGPVFWTWTNDDKTVLRITHVGIWKWTSVHPTGSNRDAGYHARHPHNDSLYQFPRGLYIWDCKQNAYFENVYWSFKNMYRPWIRAWKHV